MPGKVPAARWGACPGFLMGGAWLLGGVLPLPVRYSAAPATSAASTKVGEGTPPARGAVPFPVDSRFEFCILPPVV